MTKQPRDQHRRGHPRCSTRWSRRDDNHFGAHHYLIHGWEGSTTPEKAWRACERYPQLVPNIPHALHMPGHIYAQSDRIDDAIAAFATAADNELGWMNADVLYPNGHHGHNVHFLVQALNLDGRFNDSMTRVRHLMSFKETPRERAGSSQRVTYRQGYYSLIKTLVRFERWDLDPRRHDHSGLRQAGAAGVAAVGDGPGARSARQDGRGARRARGRCASSSRRSRRPCGR